jgi:very-short-patch-repair endonuclease
MIVSVAEPMANERARQLRRKTTLAERLLWPRLRSMKPLGLHFRRQHPIGSYIVDFARLRAKIAVEIDGSQHGEPDVTVRDEERTAYLNRHGYRVLRFWNADVLRNGVEVAETIFREATAHLRQLERL